MKKIVLCLLMSFAVAHAVDQKEQIMEEAGYTKDFIDLIELVYGEGFLSQGGTQAVDCMLGDIDLNGKKVLDIGSGLGGADVYLAQKYHTDIVALDVEPVLIQESKKRLQQVERALKGCVTCTLEGETDYLKQFDDATFDVVISKETLLHIPVKDKQTYFKQVYRVLKPGGKIIIMDWMHHTPEYSQELQKMIELDGIPYNLITKKEYLDVLQNAGFKNVSFVDTSLKTAQLSSDDCEKLIELKDTIEQRFGKETYDSSFLSWSLQKQVFENGELQTGIFRANKTGLVNFMDEKVFSALKWIIGILDRHNVPYTLSGGLGARFYGSTRPINDIDIDIPEEAFDIIYDEIKEYITFGPAQYKNPRWDIKLVRLNYHGQEIDLGGAYETKLFDHEKKEWVHSPVDFSKRREFIVDGLKIYVMDPQELIAYKKILARECDLADIEAMEKAL